MRRLSFYLILAAQAAFAGNPALPPFAIPDLDVPLFDPATGKATRRLTAPQASGFMDEPKLERATVLFFPRPAKPPRR